MIVLEVLIEYSSYQLERPFTYFYNGNKKVDRGYRVLVSFNNKMIFGYVLNSYSTEKSVNQLEDEMGFDITEIIDVIDNEPLLNDELIKLADEISDFYISPKIKVLQTMLPASLSPKKSALKGPKIAYKTYAMVNDISMDGLTHKQQEMLSFISKNNKVDVSLIHSKTILNKLVTLGKVSLIKEEKRRFEIPQYGFDKSKKLTTDQVKIINEVISCNDKIYLLEGVTGSGKTEVYLALSEHTLFKGQSVLILVPEISLTPMMMEYFIKRFKEDVAIIHSGLTPAEKYDEYRKIAKGECHVVVGARSAIFAPLKNIGLIVIDEEHADTYKQDAAPFYHAREVARMRSEHFNDCKLILGSATPSMESRIRADKGIYHLLSLPNRINERSLPTTSVINMSNYRNLNAKSLLISNALSDKINEVLNNNEQCILLLNRRGYSWSINCRNCGHIFVCPQCGVPLTYHKKENALKCHHCDYVEQYPSICPECGSKYLMKNGFGTEKVEHDIKTIFPNARTLRLDSDNARIKGKINITLEQFRKHEADILIGTQMISKGHDFPLVTLVGVVLADVGLSMPDFRATENTFELITQAVGRSGRDDKEGFAIIQTYLANHYAIQLAAKQDYKTFYLSELRNRKEQRLPPFYSLALVSISSKNEKTLVDCSVLIKEFIINKVKDNISVLGPSLPLVEQRNGVHNRQLLVKFKDITLAKNVLRNVIDSFDKKHGVSISINIDPYNF